MSLVALSQQDEYGLAHSEQDCRGWAVVDESGNELGTCTDMIVDTEAEHIDSIVLDTGARVSAASIALQTGTVIVRGQVGTAPDTGHASEQTSAAVAEGEPQEVTAPVIEEEIRVGRKEVASAGVRVTQRVIDRPVEENVTLRDERVYVERRPVNQPAATLGTGAFKEGVIEITETDEEAVVAKEARVVEEVVVSKDVTERQEVVRDTVGRADLEVQKVDAGIPSGADRAVPEDQKRQP
jgi:uncharacterized protein (TIGR02271 family)